MKRARIKAMVTVPMRRKTTQDVVNNDGSCAAEHNEETKNKLSDTFTATQQVLETNLQDTQLEERVEALENIQSKQMCVEDPNKECKDDSIQISEQSRTESEQPQKTLNATENTSPIKVTQNRLGFMRPVPKFDNNSRIRRNSVQGSGASASESEDDNKKTITTNSNCTRNDVVQSVQTSKDNSANNVKSNVITSKLGQRRRIPVSESARKLAEARREFHLKHENKAPDRSKLTMYDLIYYNPVTNPMKKSQQSVPLTKKTIEPQSEEFPEEEEEDDPSSAMPVPQVKVGPDGQLIIDEQSLIIEQTNVKKNREALIAKEAIIDDDNGGSGFYKKRQKSKEWSKYETLKFYRALNTVGTDFLLMQTLFPTRTREEIKIKFKKEERVNRELIEKALAYHQEFDIDVLQKSLATFENSEKQLSVLQDKQKQRRIRDKKSTKQSKRRKSRIASSIIDMSASDNDEDTLQSMEHTETNEESEQIFNKANKKMCKRTKIGKELTEKADIVTDDIESLSSYNGFDSDTEVYQVRPTRSGRLPKAKKLQGPDVNTLEYESLTYFPNNDETIMSPENNPEVVENIVFNDSNVDLENHHTNSIKTVIPNIGDVEPGSLVILSKESLEEPGKSVLQVYMVSSGANSEDLEKSNITPVNISPELLATVTAKLPDVEPVPVREEHE